MKLGKILVVEDDDSLQRVTQVQLENAGYETRVAGSVLQALEILKEEPQDLVISDLNLPGMSGLDLLKVIRAEYPETAVIMVTAYGSIQTAVDSMKLGAYDYLTKPIHSYELKAIVARALEHRYLVEEVRRLHSNIDEKFGFPNIIGRAPVMMHVLESAARVAQTDATVLIHGETGTGKELLAKAIHFNSPRRARPFVVINCGAIPRDLLESELFGHVKGAFTGALTHKKGKVEAADGGTIFLDEIGEMPLDLQVRVLRLIQEHEIEKVGAPNSIRVNVRIIAATHRNLEALVQSGAFREDLYYRLVVIPIEIPPLRARSEDIPEFVYEFWSQSIKKHGRLNLKLPQALVLRFSQYHWPGNVRQLQNVIERMVVLTPRDDVAESDLPEFLQHTPAGAIVLSQFPEGLTLDAVQKEMLLQALRKCNWNQTHAARQLGITRKVLMSRMVKHAISKERVEQSRAQSA